MICKNCTFTMEKWDPELWKCTNCKTEYLKYQGRGKCWTDWGDHD